MKRMDSSDQSVKRVQCKLSLLVLGWVNTNWDAEGYYPQWGKEELRDIYFPDLVPKSILGQGSFGTVYEVDNFVESKPYALKVMDGGNGFYIPHFIQECQLASHLNHPFLLKGYGCLEAEDNIYMVTEFLNGDIYEG